MSFARASKTRSRSARPVATTRASKSSTQLVRRSAGHSRTLSSSEQRRRGFRSTTTALAESRRAARQRVAQRRSNGYQLTRMKDFRVFEKDGSLVHGSRHPDARAQASSAKPQMRVATTNETNAEGDLLYGLDRETGVFHFTEHLSLHMPSLIISFPEDPADNQLLADCAEFIGDPVLREFAEHSTQREALKRLEEKEKSMALHHSSGDRDGTNAFLTVAPKSEASATDLVSRGDDDLKEARGTISAASRKERIASKRLAKSFREYKQMRLLFDDYMAEKEKNKQASLPTIHAAEAVSFGSEVSPYTGLPDRELASERDFHSERMLDRVPWHRQKVGRMYTDERDLRADYLQQFGGAEGSSGSGAGRLGTPQRDPGLLNAPRPAGNLPPTHPQSRHTRSPSSAALQQARLLARDRGRGIDDVFIKDVLD